MADPSKRETGVGFLLCDDMIFTSRIAGTARALGLSVKAFRSAAELLTAAKDETPACVIVDLSNPGLSIADLVQGLRQCGPPAPRVVAYGSHVDTATLRKAREAGCDPVLPRSKFVEELPAVLPEWMRARVDSSPKG